MLVKLFNVLAVVWLASEVILGLLLRAWRASATVRDRGSLGAPRTLFLPAASEGGIA